MASLSAGWRALTDVQRAGWKALGTAMVRTGTLGQTYTLTGLQAYTSVNRNLLTTGAATVSTAPAFVQPTQLTLLTLTATSI